MRCSKFLWLITYIILSTFSYSQPSTKNKSDLCLQRLNTLADIWGNLAIHHPKLVGQEGAWDSVLTAAIPQIEKAKATEDFVRALNNSLFSYINDFSSYASILNQAIDTTAIHIYADTVSVIKLSNKVGYIAVPGSSNYDIGLLKKIYQAVTQLKPISRLIIDLRSNKKNTYSSDWLTLWSEKEFIPGATITPVYNYYSTYGQYWLTKGSYPVKPVLGNKGWLKRIYPDDNTEDWKSIQIPTVFVVNYNSYPMVAGVLDALQKQNNIAVLFDKTNMIEKIGRASCR